MALRQNYSPCENSAQIYSLTSCAHVEHMLQLIGVSSLDRPSSCRRLHLISRCLSPFPFSLPEIINRSQYSACPRCSDISQPNKALAVSFTVSQRQANSSHWTTREATYSFVGIVEMDSIQAICPRAFGWEKDGINNPSNARIILFKYPHETRIHEMA
ncbi:hypothetical protein BJ138DRAFT_1145986 [Hygrophoropsis aurantiaca]|uniref:Uncharacterized protein n=1 Tax=Hygrophoropsis aurantiaca TaxID=72124 RepID=A0ACB8AK34_9AGAM|nr:hypothetical protein BJ138DRAFT_1145986 [Hygrophoropsis aurantiaca]